MVNNLIFRAEDTATALEKVQKSLGPNAYIIEIKNVGNFVEITASLDEPVARPQKKAPVPERPFTRANESLASFGEDQAEPDDTQSNQVQPQQPNVVQATDQTPASASIKQQELVFENVFIDEADGTDNKAEHAQSMRRPQIPRDGQGAPASDPPVIMDPVEPTAVAEEPGEQEFTAPAKKHQNARRPFQQSHELGFGDLLNLGLSGDFIKREFSIEEFKGGISKSELIHSLIAAFYDPLEKAVFENYSNLVFLGTPGAGKSTICAKLMHYYGTQYAGKPSIVHVTPEKLFEADRLNFHAKMFNFPFTRQHILDNDALCFAERQIIEIAWDFQIPFANFYASNFQRYPSVKPFLVLPAEINTETLDQVLRVCPNIKSVILNKCDYGRFSGKNLMMLYQRGCKISVLSGDRTVSGSLDVADEAMMRGFVEYTLQL